METIIYVDNLKCGGCANTISKNVSQFENVEKVSVITEESKLIIQHQKPIDEVAIKNKLHSIGYPEQNTTTGIDGITCNIKSYVSCAVGKLSAETDKSQVKE